jgi:hypothetical protein
VGHVCDSVCVGVCLCVCVEVLRGLKLWYRQMDDLRFVNCLDVDYILSDVGLYPSCLNLKETSGTNKQINK